MPDSEEGDEFDGYRYSNRVKSSENPSHWRFTSNGNDMPWFGVGKHECPGRFFGDMMLKIALIHLLSCFDWGFKEGVPKPGKYRFAHETIPDPYGVVMYRARSHKF